MKIFRVGAIVFILSSLFTHTAFANANRSAENPDDYYEQALIASEQQLYDEANIHIRNLLRQSPQHLPGQILYAQILLNKNLPSEAQVEFEKALTMGADESYVIEYLASALFAQSKYQAILNLKSKFNSATQSLTRYQLIRASASYALGDVQAAIDNLQQLALLSAKQSPNEPDIPLELSSIYLDLNDLNKAQNTLQAVATFAQNEPKYWYLQGRLSSLQQEYSVAIKRYQQSIQLDPQKSSVYKGLANAYVAIGELDAASDAIENALALAPNDPLAIYIQSEIFKQMDQPQAADKALDYISNRISLIDSRTKRLNPQLLLIDAMSSYSGGNWQQSVRKFTAYLENHPDDLNARVLLSRVYHQSNQPQQALDVLLPFKTELVLNQEYALVLAVAYVENGDLESAISLLQRRILLDKYDSSAVLLLVKIYEEQQEHLRAYQLLSAAIQPEKAIASPLITQALARVTYKMQRFAESLKYVETLLKLNSSNVTVALFRVELLGKLGRYTEALHGVDHVLANFDPSQNIPPNLYIIRINLLHQLGQIAQRNTQFGVLYERWQANPERLVGLAKMQASMGFIDGAQESFTQAVRLAPTDENVILAYAKWSMQQGNILGAKQLITGLDNTQVINKAQLLALQGDINVALNQPQAAYDYYKQAVQGSYTEVLTINKLAQVSLDIDRAHEVSALLKTLITRYPKRVFLVESLGEHLLESGQHEDAIFYYSQLLTAPMPVIKQSIALNNLAFLYTQTKQYSLAIEHAKQALKLRSDIPAFYDTLGWALTLSGQYNQGKKYLEQALSMAGESAEIQAHLTYTLDKLNTQAAN